jgi:hypothetical protein
MLNHLYYRGLHCNINYMIRRNKDEFSLLSTPYRTIIKV